MMNISKPICLLLLFAMSMGCFPVLAQQKDSVSVVLQAHPTRDRILLRWAINDPYTWSKSLTAAYTIERYTVRRNGSILPEPERKILTPTPVSAAPEAQWESLAQKNSYAAILAQALFGEDFEVSGLNTGNSIKNIISRSEALNQRYSFALYAADMCFEGACLAGWGYEDRDVLPGEFYLYRVIPTGLAEAGYPVKYGFVYTSIDEYRELPRPLDLVAEFGDKSVQLAWNTSLYRELFAAYQVEKSEDNLHFEPQGMPYTPLDDKEFTLFIDSLAENDKTYYYRIRGLSIFGEISEPSDTVFGKGREALRAVPAITRTNILESGAAQIEWLFEEESEPLIRSFDLIRSDRESGPYETASSAIPAHVRSVIYTGLHASNYFRIAANGLDGKQNLSFPVLVQPVDSIPPAAPQQLTGQADTTGLVYLKWKANTEADLQGYKLYRGNRKGEELIPITPEVVQQTQYTDTVDLMNLNTHVYYALKAFDERFNQSDFSATIEVEKPLKVKPSPPVFTSFQSESGGITLHWIPSSSPETALHTLYRREENSTENQALTVFRKPDTTTVYRDVNTEGNKVYIYTITASSKWNVESNPSPEYRVSVLPSDKIQALKELKASVDSEKKQIKITWKATAIEKVKRWKIYRAENEAPISIWKELPKEDVFVWDDFPLKVGNTYTYMVIALMNDGGISNQEKITINY
jgi:fibronectin type 3 domain-containing protein